MISMCTEIHEGGSDLTSFVIKTKCDATARRLDIDPKGSFLIVI